MSRGILYIAAGSTFVQEARESARSAKEQMPDVPIAIITDSEEPGKEFDEVISLRDPDYSVVDKSANIHRSPFNKTLYLDTDTFVCRPVDDIFDVLDKYEIATPLSKGEKFDIGLPPSVPHRSAGVIAFNRSPGVMELFESWGNIYSKTRSEGFSSDQPPLTKAILESGIAVHTLPVEDNCFVYYGERLQGPVRILHGHEDLKILEKDLNKESRSRVFTSFFDNEIVFVDQESMPLIGLFWISMKRDGMKATIKRVKKAINSKLS